MIGRNGQRQPKEAAEMNLTEEWVELPQALLYLNGKWSFLPPVAFRAIRKPKDLSPAKQAREQLVAGLATGGIRHSGVAAIVRPGDQGAVIEVASLPGSYSLPANHWNIDQIDFYNSLIDLPGIPEDIRQDLEAGHGHEGERFRLRDIRVSAEDLFKIKPPSQSRGPKLRGGAPIQKDWDHFWRNVVWHMQEEGFPQDDNDWKKLNKYLYEHFPDIDESLIRRKISAIRAQPQD